MKRVKTCEKTYIVFAVILAAFFVFALSVDAFAADEGEGGEQAISQSVFDSIKNFIIGLVVPSDDFFNTEFEKLNEKLAVKMPYATYVATIGRFKEVTDFFVDNNADNPVTFDASDHSIDGGINAVAALVFTFGYPYFDFFRPIIYGFYVFVLVFYNYRQIMYLVRGSNYQNMQGVTTTEDGEVTGRFEMWRG